MQYPFTHYSLLLWEERQLFVNFIPTQYAMYRIGKRSVWFKQNYDVLDDSKSAQLLELLLCYMGTFCGTRNYWRDWRAMPDKMRYNSSTLFFFKIWEDCYRSFLQSREKSLAWSLILRNVSASIFSKGYFSVVWFKIFFVWKKWNTLLLNVFISHADTIYYILKKPMKLIEWCYLESFSVSQFLHFVCKSLKGRLLLCFSSRGI